MPTKSEWEHRVGMLLDARRAPEFVYSYKPVDGMHGGQPKIDWFACDKDGRFWLIEVKLLADDRKSINLYNDVTAGQRDGLKAVSRSAQGVALLAVGHKKALHLFDWSDVRCQLEQPKPSPLLPLDRSFLILDWTGPKNWRFPLYTLVTERAPNSEPIQPISEQPSRARTRFPLT